MAKVKEPESMSAYAISCLGVLQRVVIGTKGDAVAKLTALAQRAFNTLSPDVKEEWMTAARRASARSGYEYFRQVQRWEVRGPVEYSIAIKP